MSAESEPPDWSADLVGMDEDAAGAHATAHGASLRVIERDGRSLPMTMDYRESRLNVTVADGRVAAVHSRG
jgi:hypothetical protein